MSENAAQAAGCSIVLASLRGGSQLSVAAAEMARMFALDFRVAEQVIRRAPIIVFKDMTDEEVHAGKAHLLALLRFGLDFRITRNPPINYPKVNWPAKPDYASMFSAPPPEPPAPAAPSAMEVTVQLLCPCCGSTLRMRVDAVTVASGAAAIASGIEAQKTEARGQAETGAAPQALTEPPAAGETTRYVDGAQAHDADHSGAGGVPESASAPIPGPSAVEAEKPAADAQTAPEAGPEPVPVAVMTAIAVEEEESDAPWSFGSFDAVPVDDVQEDALFSSFGGAPLMDRILFGKFASLASDPESAGVRKPDQEALPAAREDELVEVEAQDASGGLDDLLEEGVAIMPIEPEAAAETSTQPEEVTADDEELIPWTGSARKYKAKDATEAGTPEQPVATDPEAEPPAPEVPAASDEAPPEAPALDEVTVADEELVPWTGSARKYKTDTTKVEKGPEPSPDKPLRKAIGDLEDLEDVPEIDLAAPEEMGMGKALVADVAEKDGEPGLEEGLEDVPEIKHSSESGPAQPDDDKSPPGATKLRKIKRIIKPGEKPAMPVKPADEPAPAKPAEKEQPPAAAARVVLKARTVVVAKPGSAETSKPVKTVVAARPLSAAPAAKTVVAAAPVAKIKRPTGEIPKKASDEEEEGDGEYSVFLSKIVSPDRQRKAVEILSEIKGISDDEAEKLTKKMIIPVIKGVGKDEAEQILEKFKQSKISGRITRKK